MKKITATFLLLVFAGFVASLSINYGGYLKLVNGGTAVEDVQSIPEEHHEKNVLDEKAKNFHAVAEILRLTQGSDHILATQYSQFSVLENVCLDVPYSPPEWCS